MSKTGLINSLNKMRELSSDIYHRDIPIIMENDDISILSNPIMNNQELRNEFMSVIVNKIVEQKVERKIFTNPLAFLEGDRIPLGYVVEETYTNPAIGREYNIEDFAGLLVKYESDVKVQYLKVNDDKQFPVTINRSKLLQGFSSWSNLESLIDSITDSLYNGAYIYAYNKTKSLIATAYQQNLAKLIVINDPKSSEANAKKFTETVRTLYLNFKDPSDDYNAWGKLRNDKNPIITWSNPDEIVTILRNDINSSLSVNVLAAAMNMQEATLMGNIHSLKDFNILNNNKVTYDGSKIYAFIGDKRFFRIRTQDEALETFYNANNRTYQFYLNITKMYELSLFSNAVILCSEIPKIAVTGLEFKNSDTTINIGVGDELELGINVTPSNGNNPKITYSSSDATKVSIITDDNNDRIVTIKGVAAGTITLTATSGNVSVTKSIKVE